METVSLPGMVVVSREFDSRGREIPGRVIRKTYEDDDPTQHLGVFRFLRGQIQKQLESEALNHEPEPIRWPG